MNFSVSAFPWRSSSFSRITLAAIAGCGLLLCGCGRNVEKTPEKTKSAKNGKEDPPRAIAKKPDTDELAKAVESENGDVAAALKKIRAHCQVDTEGKIQFVDLSGKKLTAEGLKHLLALKKTLQRISLNRVFVNAEALKVLAELPHLRTLELNLTPVTDDGLQHLRKCSELRELSLKETRIGDPGLEHVGALKELTQLSLTGTLVSDAGLAHLAELDKLATLIIENTAISDDGLRHLQRLKSLRYLYVIGTKITLAGVNRFRQLSPRVRVIGPGPKNQP